MSETTRCHNCGGGHRKSFSLLRMMDADLEKWAPTPTGWEADMYYCTECDGYEREREQWWERQREKRR